MAPVKPKESSYAFPQHFDNAHSIKEVSHRPEIPLIAKAIIPAG
jgi:hypothetical protein